MERRKFMALVCGAATNLLLVARGDTMDAKLAVIDDLKPRAALIYDWDPLATFY